MRVVLFFVDTGVALGCAPMVLLCLKHFESVAQVMLVLLEVLFSYRRLTRNDSDSC